MASWFDIKSLTPGGPEPEDEAGMMKSVQTIQSFIRSEVDAGIEAKRVVVGGFSQGESARRRTRDRTASSSPRRSLTLSPPSRSTLSLTSIYTSSLHTPIYPSPSHRSRHRPPYRRRDGIPPRRPHLPLRFPRPSAQAQVPPSGSCSQVSCVLGSWNG